MHNVILQLSNIKKNVTKDILLSKLVLLKNTYYFNKYAILLRQARKIRALKQNVQKHIKTKNVGCFTLEA